MPPRVSLRPCPGCRLRNRTRLFSSTTTALAPPKTNPLSLLQPNAPPPPPYPYGHSFFYKQRNTGLYGGAMIQFGNNVSERTETKTRRSWLPNIMIKSVYSRVLGRSVRVKVSTRVLRTIDKVGGLDQYLLGDTAGRVKELGEQGWKLRWAILNHPSMRKKMKEDGKLRALLEGFAQAVVVPGTVVVGKPRRERVALAGHGSARDDLDMEERVSRRIREGSHMAEAQTPETFWQRMRRAISRPFSRG